MSYDQPTLRHKKTFDNLTGHNGVAGGLKAPKNGSKNGGGRRGEKNEYPGHSKPGSERHSDYKNDAGDGPDRQRKTRNRGAWPNDEGLRASSKHVSLGGAIDKLLGRLKAEAHPTTPKPRNKEPKSRREYQAAMTRLKGEDFWSDEVKANKKVIAAAKAAARRKRIEMPANSAPVPEAGELRDDFLGIVLPMGHGKSRLAREEGWVDFDSLIAPKRRGELLEEVFERIAGGETIAQALTVFVPEAKKTLALLRPLKRWVLMVQDASLLRALNIECVGGILINPEVVLSANTGRSEHERLLIEKNMEEVQIEREAAGGVLVAETYDEARMLAYEVCCAVGVPVSRPSDFGLEDCYSSGGPGSSSQKVNLEDAISAFDQGKIPKESVDHQVYLHNMTSYKGFGFGPDRWAKLMSRVTSTIGDVAYADEDWNPEPVSLATFSETTDLSSHADVQYILSAQKGEHERFILGLILHWKAIGMHCGLGNRLLPLYGVRRAHWPSVMNALREGVAISNSFMTIELSQEEKTHIMSMGLLVSGSLKDLKSQMYSMKSCYPRSAPGPEIENKVKHKLSKVVYTREYDASVSKGLGRLISASKIASISQLAWEVDGAPGRMKRSESIALHIGMELYERWDGDEIAQARIPGIMHKLVTKWYKMGVIRDEWADFISRTLDDEVDNHGLGRAIATICSCPKELGGVGADWGMRTCEALKGFIVCAIVASGDTIIGVVRDNNTKECRPCVGGMSEGELWASIIRSNIPKHALGIYGGAVSALSLANDLCQWKDSPTVALVEMINCKSWDPEISDKQMATLLYRWGRVTERSLDDGIRKFLLDAHSRPLFSHSYSRIAGRLEMYARLRNSDGGLGCHTEYSNKGRLKLDRNKVWTGHGAVETTEVRHKENKKTLEQRIGEFQDPEFNFGVDSHMYTGINLCGMVVCALLQDHGKSALNSNGLLLHQLSGR